MDRYEIIAALVLSLFLIPVGYLVFIFVISPLKFRLSEKRHPPRKLDDPVFGNIEFHDGLWSSIPAQNLDHLIVVDAPETGPTQKQRGFYTKLRNELAIREAECKAFMAKHTDPPSNLPKLAVYSVEIGTESEITTGQFVIELSDGEADKIHRVEFRDGKPTTYGVDD